MSLDWKKFARTKFAGWVAPDASEEQIFAEAVVRAESARDFLDNDIVVRAYQNMLDRIVDELLSTPTSETEKVLHAHARASSLVSLVLQMKTYMNDVEILSAERRKKEKEGSPRKAPEGSSGK